MVTPLQRPLRREVQVDGKPYVVTLTAEGLRIVPKGHRKGVEVSWQDILNGGATLQSQLVDSLREAK